MEHKPDGTRPSNGELAVIAVTLAFVFFITGIFFGRSRLDAGFAVYTEIGGVEYMPETETEPGASLPAAGTGETEPPRVSVGGESAAGKVNINEAMPEELQVLPGVGPALAKRIIDYRVQNGPFKDIIEIMNVPGIGEKTFDGLEEMITVRRDSEE